MPGKPVLLLAAALGVFVSRWCEAQSRTETVFQTGQLSPDGDGTFSNFLRPILNNRSEVAFVGSLTGNSGGAANNSGVFFGSIGTSGQIVREGQMIPGGSGTVSAFSDLVQFNNNGQVFVWLALGGQLAAIRGDGSSLDLIVRDGQVSPDGNGTFSSVQLPVGNEVGQAAFRASLVSTSGGSLDNSGIVRGDGNELSFLVREGWSAPDGNGVFSEFPEPFYLGVINTAGQVVFHARLRGNSGGTAEDWGIYVADGTSTTRIVSEGQNAPDMNGVFADLSSGGRATTINDFGHVTFDADLTGTIGGTSDDRGIFVSNGSVLTQIAREGQLVANGNGVLLNWDFVETNSVGQAAFHANLANTIGGTSDNTGIYRAGGGALTEIARKGQASPDGNGFFSDLTQEHILLIDSTRLQPEMNDAGQVVFGATLSGTSGGSSDDVGIFTSDGIDSLAIVRKGDAIAGSTIQTIDFSRWSGLNEHGQVAYHARLADGRQMLQLWTPDLHWRSGTNGSWGNSANWTLGLSPALVHDVFIDPSVSLTVTGPVSDTSIRSLTVGGGAGVAELTLTGSSVLSVSDGVIIRSNGILSGTGTIAGDTISSGMISPGASAGDLLFDGSLVLTNSSRVEIQLGGVDLAEYDRILIRDDLQLDGLLDVSLINGHLLDANQSYLFAEIDGLVSGFFIGLGEGGLVGNYGGHNLFITYFGGDGNDIALFTAIPEPCLGLPFVLSVLATGLRLRTRHSRS